MTCEKRPVETWFGRKLIHRQRVALATLLTTICVGTLEVAHFESGTSPVLEIGYFAVPALAALALVKSVKERTFAFVLLTLAGFLAAASADVIYLTN